MDEDGNKYRKWLKVLRRYLVVLLAVMAVLLNIFWIAQSPTTEPMIGIVNSLVMVILAIE